MTQTETIIPDDVNLSLPGPHDTARSEVRRAIEAEMKSQAWVAKQCDVAGSTFAAWMSASYAGNNDPILEKVTAWLASRKTAERTRATMRKVPTFVMTPSAEAFQSVLELAHHTPDLVVIAGGPGVGKTVTCTAYVRANTNVWMATAEPAWNTPRMLLDCVAEAVGVTERYSAQRISRAIQIRLRGSSGLLIMDEANHLNTESIDQLRTFFDLAGVGVALVGNDTIYSWLEGEGRKAQFAQLFSRIGMRLSRPKPYSKDVDVLLDAWGIESVPERRMLHAIARKPGALRGMTKTLRSAFMKCAAAGREVLIADDIAQAWAQISSTSITEEAV